MRDSPVPSLILLELDPTRSATETKLPSTHQLLRFRLCPHSISFRFDFSRHASSLLDLKLDLKIAPLLGLPFDVALVGAHLLTPCPSTLSSALVEAASRADIPGREREWEVDVDPADALCGAMQPFVNYLEHKERA